MTGLMPTGTLASTVPKPAASTGLLRSQLGLLAWAVAEQSGTLMMLTEPGLTPSPALATTISLRTGAVSAHSGLVPTTMGFVAPVRDDIEGVGLSVDDGDGTVGLVEDEGTFGGAGGIAGHDAVDGTTADGNRIGIDGIAGCLDGIDLTRTAAIALADGEDTRGVGDADGVDGAEGRIDGKLLLQAEGGAVELPTNWKIALGPPVALLAQGPGLVAEFVT